MSAPWIYGAMSREESESKLNRRAEMQKRSGGAAAALVSCLISLSYFTSTEIMKEGHASDGDFLVRLRDPGSADYILVLIFKGKPTHHLMHKNEQGQWTINKKVYVEEGTIEGVSKQGRRKGRNSVVQSTPIVVSTRFLIQFPTRRPCVPLFQVIAALKKPVQGWPIVLQTGIVIDTEDVERLLGRKVRSLARL